MIDLLLYIDPASTALIWQILAGVFISLSVALGIWWRKITTFFHSVWVKLFRKKEKGQQTYNEGVDELDEELLDPIKETKVDVGIKEPSDNDNTEEKVEKKLPENKNKK